MGREPDVTPREREDEARVEPARRGGRRYLLVGAPGSGKSQLAFSITETLPDLAKRPEPWLYVAPVGLQADYRTELLIASNRASSLHIQPELDYLLLHSMVDSLAYSITNVRRLAQNDGVNAETTDAMTWAAGSIQWMFRHSLRYDHVFFLEDENLDEEMYDFQIMLREILDGNSMPYTILEGDKANWPEQVIGVIRDYGKG